jgi:hypothetical protein
VQEESSLVVEASDLHPFSHWTTPPGPPRRFATWFFISHILKGDVMVDGTETSAHRWSTPADALAAHAAGELELPPATFVSLTWLQRFGEVKTVSDALQNWSTAHYVPRSLPVEGGICSLYEGDAGYDAADVEALGPRHRLWRIGNDWRYEEV